MVQVVSDNKFITEMAQYSFDRSASSASIQEASCVKKIVNIVESTQNIRVWAYGRQ